MTDALRTFLVLAGEACRDGVRRRFVVVVGLLLFVGLGATESCTDAGVEGVVVNGQALDAQATAGFLAPVLFAAQALLVVVMAGVLASDHLARPLGEGSALLWLARPVSRGSYAAARLVGVLSVALGAGLILLSGTGGMLVARQGLAVVPALIAAVGMALGCVVVSAFAMAASLSLGRTAVLLLVVIGVPFIAASNAWAFLSMLIQAEGESSGISGALLDFGPPIGLGIFAPLAVWNPYVEESPAASLLLRLFLWALGALGVLWWGVRRVEVGAGHDD